MTEVVGIRRKTECDGRCRRPLPSKGLDGSYDCVDRVVLHAYFQLGQRAAGLRMWWRRRQGSDEGLNNTRLMRVAGRFARRVKGWAKGAGVPVVYSKSGERNEDLARGYLPDDPSYEGVFVVIVRRVPGNARLVGRLGAARVGGIDINRARARAVMQALLALSPNPAGFTSSELATKVARLLDDERYSPSRAAYDLRKFRCKGLAAKMPRSRRYRADAEALRAMAALLLLRDKVVHPLLAAASAPRRAPRPRTSSAVDQRYAAVHHEMRSLFESSASPLELHPQLFQNL